MLLKLDFYNSYFVFKVKEIFPKPFFDRLTIEFLVPLIIQGDYHNREHK